MRRCNGAEKSKPSQATSMAPTKSSCVPNFNSLTYFRGKIREETPVFKVKKREAFIYIYLFLIGLGALADFGCLM